MLVLKWGQRAETTAHHTGSPLLSFKYPLHPPTRPLQVDGQVPTGGDSLLISVSLWIPEDT